jgi:translation initiation factor 5
MPQVHVGSEKASLDPFYRYKRPTVEVKTHGKKPMQKTHITNLDEVSRGLGRSSVSLLKYMGYALAAAINTKQKWIQGSFSVAQLEEAIGQFTTELVLCQTCELPELDMKVRKTYVKFSCRACGAKCKISPTYPRLLKFL